MVFGITFLHIQSMPSSPRTSVCKNHLPCRGLEPVESVWGRVPIKVTISVHTNIQEMILSNAVF